MQSLVVPPNSYPYILWDETQKQTKTPCKETHVGRENVFSQKSRLVKYDGNSHKYVKTWGAYVEESQKINKNVGWDSSLVLALCTGPQSYLLGCVTISI